MRRLTLVKQQAHDTILMITFVEMKAFSTKSSSLSDAIQANVGGGIVVHTSLISAYLFVLRSVLGVSILDIVLGIAQHPKKC